MKLLFAFLIDSLKKWWGDEPSPYLLHGFLLVIWHGLRLPITCAGWRDARSASFKDKAHRRGGFNMRYLLVLLFVGAAQNALAATDCTAVTEIPPVECEALVALYTSTNGANWSNNAGWNVTNTPCSWSGVSCNAGHVTNINKILSKLTGTIPPELGNLSNLTSLQLNDNQLTGTIPPGLGNLSNLTILGLDSNQLTGTIPPGLGNLSNLTTLGLDSNQLTGTIPPELGNLSSLSSLSLGCNLLTIPSDQSLLDFINAKDVSNPNWKDTQDGNCSSGSSTPLAPTALNATVASQTQINLSWTDNSSDETGFKIERNGALIQTTAINISSFNDTGLLCGTIYNYLVKATNASGDSTPATTIGTTPACTGFPPSLPIALIAPTALNAMVASQTQINLTWIDNSSDETGFKIERNTALIQTTAADVVSFNDTSLLCGTIYNYLVKATNANGDSTAITTSGTTLACSSTPTISGPPVPSLPPPPTGGNISGSRNMGGQTFIDDSTIGENTSVSNVVFAADVENEGLISNSTIAADATLTGGTLTSNITNEGTISDVDFVGNKLSGGTLAGTITNSSKIGGTIEDVQLAPKATLSGGQVGGLIKSAADATLQDVQFEKGGILIGGQLSGEISGDPDNPPQIGAAEIMPGSKLSNVRLSPTMQIPEDVELGENVRLPADYENPTLEDFGIDPNELDDMTAERITQLEPAAFSVLTAADIAKISPEAFSAIEAEQMTYFTKSAIDGLTVEQFEQIPTEALGGLTSENMGGLSTDVVSQFTPTTVTALNTEQFKQMPSRDVSKLFVNIDLEKISPPNVEQLVPDGWILDLESGDLKAPVGAGLSFQSLPPFGLLPSQVILPAFANLNSGLGIGGIGPTLLEGTKRSLVEENLEEFVLSQDDYGILLVEGTGDLAGINYTFIPDVDNAIQVDTDKIPIGLNVGKGGFYTITTPEGEQYKVVPAPQNPVALSETIGGGEVVIGERGDVMIEIATPTRRKKRGKTRQVLIFDPFIEPGIDDSCVEIVLGEFACDEFDDLRAGKRRLRQRIQTRKIKYPDGTAQTIYPTVLSPDVFIEKGLEFEGVENVVFNANGTFYIAIGGKPYLVYPKWEVGSEEVPEAESVEPTIAINVAGGQIRYTIPIESSEDDNRRRGKTREVLIFDPFIEPAPDDMCTEPVPGEIVCDFIDD